MITYSYIATNKEGILSFFVDGKISTFVIDEKNNIELVKFLSQFWNKKTKSSNDIFVTYNKKSNILEYALGSDVITFSQQYNKINSNIYIVDLMYILNMHETKKDDTNYNLKKYAIRKDIYIYNKASSLDEAIHINENRLKAITDLAQENKHVIDFCLQYAKNNNIFYVSSTPTKLLLQHFINKYKIELDAPKEEKVITIDNLTPKPLVHKYKQLEEKLRNVNILEIDNNIKYFIKNIALSINKTGVYYSEQNYFLDKDNTVLAHLDFKSFFASIMLKYNIAPSFVSNFKQEFLDYIKKILEYKDKSTHFGSIYKQVLVNIIGLFNHMSKYYSPTTFYSITFNGIYEIINTIEEILNILPLARIVHVRVDGVYLEIDTLHKDILEKYIENKNKQEQWMKIKLTFYDKAYIDNNGGFILLQKTQQQNDAIKKEDFHKILENTFFDFNDKVIYDGFNYYTVKVSSKYNTDKYSTVPLISKYAFIYRMLFKGSVLEKIINTGNINLYAFIYENDNFYAEILEHGEVKKLYVPANVFLVVKCRHNRYKTKDNVLPLMYIDKNTKIDYNYYVNQTKNNISDQMILNFNV